MSVHIVPGVVCGLAGLPVAVLTQPLVKRLPSHQSLTSTPSHCGNCGVRTSRVQSASLLARVSGQRYCDNCNVALWPKFPGLEIFAAVTLGIVGATAGWTWNLPALLVFFMTLVLITVIDMRHYMIPTRLVYPSLLVTLILLAVANAAHHPAGTHHFRDALIGMAAAWLFFAVVWFIYPAGMGFGDVRLSALIGLASGYVGIGNVVLAILLALVIGAAAGVALMILSLRSRKQAIPFGPFLAAGAALSVLWGGQIVGN